MKTSCIHMIRMPSIRHIARLALTTLSCLSAGLLVLAASPAQACGLESDCPVALDNGTITGSYRIRMPVGGSQTAADNVAEDKVAADKVNGAIVYLHGWQGTPEGTMKFGALTRMADELGVALIAPRGLRKSWSFPRAGRILARDDVAFINAVANDAALRFSIDRERFMLTGFSVGGSMVWYAACKEPDMFAGYAPIAGAFWVPYPPECRSPAPDLFHVHGTADRTVPLQGRKLGNGAQQGDVTISFGILLDTAPIAIDRNAVSPGDQSRLTCEHFRAHGNRQEICLHGGGHSVRPEWISRAWRELAAVRQWD